VTRWTVPGGRFLIADETTAPSIAPGVRWIDPEDPMSDRAKAPADGTYLLNGNRFHAKKGALLPPGATFEATPPATPPKAETRKSKGPAENERATGPAETE
jgi:hypothetical protein